MNKAILCAIDFSESSLQALKWTMKVAQERQAPVTILFCYRLVAVEEDEAIDMKKNLEKEALKKFTEIERRLINGKNISYQFVTEVGFFPSRIEMFIRKWPVGLLVMGNSVVKNFNEYKNFNFEQFLTQSTVPVVIVPEKLKEMISI